MKNFLKFLFLISILLFLSYNFTFSYTGGVTIVDNLNNLFAETKTNLVNPGNNMSIGSGFKVFTDRILNNISVLLGIGAVFGIAFGGFKMVTSAGEEDKISSAKNIIKWSIIGFVGIITANLLINIVVRIMYQL